MQLVVLGMHRSGTSGVTRLLNLAGAYFGPEGIATVANEENPKGFWERRDVRAACDGLLQESGFDWWRVADFALDRIPTDVRARYGAELARIVAELDEHRPWVLKEPRLCLLFPVLQSGLESPVAIHVTREPLEVAKSLQTRNDIPEAAGLALWERYTIDALAASAGLPRLLARFEDLMADPVGTTARLVAELEALGVDGLHVPSEQEITEFIAPDLHHERHTPESRRAWLNAAQAELADAIDDGSILDLDLTSRTTSDGSLASLRLLEADAARDERVDELEKNVGTLERTIGNLERSLTIRTEASERRTDRLEQRALAADDRLAARPRELRATRATAERALRDAERRIRSARRSRALRITTKLAALAQRLTPGEKRARVGPLDQAIAGLRRSRLELEAKGVSGTPPRAGATTTASSGDAAAPRRALNRSRRPKVAVVAWDAGHNPLGRAYVLAGMLSRRFDVEIWGAQFERYGTRVWAPLRDSEIPVRTFEGKPFPDHLAVMQRVAKEIDADAVWVSKPRLPAYALGVFAKQARNRPLVLDVDDHELAFFDEDDGLEPGEVLRIRGDAALTLPFERAWTRFCEPLIDAADLVTVSNVALQARFGGVIVPHARDERVFDPARYDREATRQQLGISTDTRLLLFGGTPRVHKGILEVLRALEQIGDERYRVLLFGTREFDELRKDIGPLERWAIPLPYQRFDDLPELVGAADLACVLQDASHPVARYQLPAKVTDALAMGVPCLVRPVRPLASFIEADVLQVLHDGELLPERITRIFDHYDDALDRAKRGREVFEESYSYEAVSEAIAPQFEALIAQPPPVSPRLRTVVDVPRQIFGTRGERSRRPARIPGRAVTKVAPDGKYDVVVFWKQNDTGIYGRRQDMFVKYLAASGRVRSIVHFDNPTTPEKMYAIYRNADSTADQGRLVVRQTVQRVLRRRDVADTHYYTFVFGGRVSRRVGLRNRDQYPEYVRSVLERHGIGERPTIFWVYPTNKDLPRIIDELDPDIVVADVVDDNRTWYADDTPEYDRVERNYEEVLAPRSDVVLANCEPVAASMARFAPLVHVIPNGLELRTDAAGAARPKELEGLTGPIVGYVGNLSSRIDIELLETLAEAHPQWQFVFVGSAHLDRSILRLESRANVHFAGVRPYEEALRFVEHFDVGLIPHLDDEMTRSMNPLKAFVYCAAGVPVVSTPVANLGELASMITVAEGPDAFGAAIEAALRSGRRPVDVDALRPHSWDERVAHTLELIDQSSKSSPASRPR